MANKDNRKNISVQPVTYEKFLKLKKAYPKIYTSFSKTIRIAMDLLAVKKGVEDETN